MATIIIKHGSGSNNVPSSLIQGELAINVDDGKLFFGSGSSGEVRTLTASLALSASYLIGGVSGAGGPNTSVQFNDGGTFSGSNNFTFDNTNNLLFITGGLNLSSQGGQSILTITSGSNKVLTVTGSGVTVFGTYSNVPLAEAGGIYFNGNDFFLGF
jgi:hypothetical protein